MYIQLEQVDMSVNNWMSNYNNWVHDCACLHSYLVEPSIDPSSRSPQTPKIRVFLDINKRLPLQWWQKQRLHHRSATFTQEAMNK